LALARNLHPCPAALTQIVTQVCGKARGRSGQNGTKCGTFCVLNGRIGRKNARNHEPMPSGSHEVSGSIPLISTRKVLKSHDFIPKPN